MIGFITAALGWMASGLIAFLLEGPREARLILDNPYGPDLDKKTLVRRRIFILAPVVLVCWIGGGLGWAGLPAYALAAWGAFGPVHRWTLNMDRRMKRWYLSPKNSYDAFWLGLFGSWPMKRTAWVMYAFEVLAGLLGLTGAWALASA